MGPLQKCRDDFDIEKAWEESKRSVSRFLDLFVVKVRNCLLIKNVQLIVQNRYSRFILCQIKVKGI